MTARRILAVDDDRVTLQCLTALLCKAGYAPLSAQDPVQAMMQAQRQAPDLIITDMLMPAGGGFAVLERLMKSLKTSHIPVLVLTASDDPEMEQRALRLGALRVLRKPYDPAILLEAVRFVVGN
jgi:CheY-like chemotaxis protein